MIHPVTRRNQVSFVHFQAIRSFPHPQAIIIVASKHAEVIVATVKSATVKSAPQTKSILGTVPSTAPAPASSNTATVETTQPKPTAQAEPSESEEESDTTEDDSEEDSEEDSEDSEEEMTATQKQAAQKKAEAAARRAKAREEALAARSKDNLRSPICYILGHVDTGKTKLLDKIHVQEGEAGGITQQIGATYFPAEAIKTKTAVMNRDNQQEYKIPGLLIIDTPGHESFTNLRSRGSSLCNIAILVVDIMHGLEVQTLESLRLLRDRKTPFIVALNKIDRIYGWVATPDGAFRESLAKQSCSVQREFEDRLSKTILAFAEEGLNACLYYEDKNMGRNVSLVPTSAITGEGVPDMIMLLVNLTQRRMSDRLVYLSELECTVLEVKVIEGLGTTIDVVLSNAIRAFLAESYLFGLKWTPSQAFILQTSCETSYTECRWRGRRARATSDSLFDSYSVPPISNARCLFSPYARSSRTWCLFIHTIDPFVSFSSPNLVPPPISLSYAHLFLLAMSFIPYTLTRTLDAGAHQAAINVVTFSPFGDYLLSGGDDRVVAIWDVKTGALLQRIIVQTPVISLIWHPRDRESFFVGCQNAVYFIDSFNPHEENTAREVLTGVEASVESLDIDATSGYLAMAVGREVQVAKQITDRNYATFVVMPDPPILPQSAADSVKPRSAHFLPGGRKLVASYLSHGPLINVQPRGSSCLSPDYRKVLVYNMHNGMELYHLAQDVPVQTYQYKIIPGYNYPMKVSFTGSYGLSVVAGAQDGKVRIWDRTTGRQQQTHQESAFAFIATANADTSDAYTINIWKAPIELASETLDIGFEGACDEDWLDDISWRRGQIIWAALFFSSLLVAVVFAPVAAQVEPAIHIVFSNIWRTLLTFCESTIRGVEMIMDEYWMVVKPYLQRTLKALLDDDEDFVELKIRRPGQVSSFLSIGPLFTVFSRLFYNHIGVPRHLESICSDLQPSPCHDCDEFLEGRYKDLDIEFASTSDHHDGYVARGASPRDNIPLPASITTDQITQPPRSRQNRAPTPDAACPFTDMPTVADIRVGKERLSRRKRGGKALASELVRQLGIVTMCDPTLARTMNLEIGEYSLESVLKEVARSMAQFPNLHTVKLLIVFQFASETVVPAKNVFKVHRYPQIKHLVLDRTSYPFMLSCPNATKIERLPTSHYNANHFVQDAPWLPASDAQFLEYAATCNMVEIMTLTFTPEQHIGISDDIGAVDPCLRALETLRQLEVIYVKFRKDEGNEICGGGINMQIVERLRGRRSKSSAWREEETVAAKYSSKICKAASYYGSVVPHRDLACNLSSFLPSEGVLELD
ncbi:hypothetical protein NLJ89_g9810 [Agrocybe chaxingu]|uniref:Tr-type G domain-containing protein n=1 Tax=Agrocybe chaxingu TaxID=84603 RepID=A0A9W8JRQ8_9AGAR|nr:hypothetical protein NLJ89_g9810 [Agrocybe chaxingu]